MTVNHDVRALPPNGSGNPASSTGIRHSIIIVSYQRDDCLRENIDLLEHIVGHRSDVELVLVDNNADDIDREPLLHGFRNKKYINSGGNLGAAGGRNKGIEASRGEFLTFFDDDAMVQEPNFLEIIEEVFSWDKRIAIISAKSITFSLNIVEDRSFPHTNKKLDKDQAFYTHRFIGNGCAIRSELFRDVGLYDPSFIVYMEEFDLSYRAINAGWKIRYEPRIWVYHKKAKTGRAPALTSIEREFLNKLKVSYRHLPAHLFVINSIAWSGYTAIRSRARANQVRVLRQFLQWSRDHRHLRQPLGPAARAYVRACGAALWK